MTTDTPHILIVDDDAHIRDVIRLALEGADMRTSEAENGRAALAAITGHAPSLVMLDIGMPEMDGFETCREIRANSDVPILFLTARDDEIDRVLGFEFGADDFVSKPFSPRELVLRVRAILKRKAIPAPVQKNVRFQGLEMAPASHACTLDGTALQLTGIEYALLLTLLRAPEQVFSRAQLITAIYGANTYLSDRTVDSHISNIRRKAAALGHDDVIRTVHGVGVRLGACKA